MKPCFFRILVYWNQLGPVIAAYGITGNRFGFDQQS